MKRLYLILRDKQYANLIIGDQLDVLGALEAGKKLIKKHKKVFIVGLNHWFTEKDIEILENLYRENFI